MDIYFLNPSVTERIFYVHFFIQFSGLFTPQQMGNVKKSYRSVWRDIIKVKQQKERKSRKKGKS